MIDAEKQSVLKENLFNNDKMKESFNTSFEISNSIIGVEAQISEMNNKLLNPNLSEISKIRIRIKMEALASKLVLLRKKKLNSSPLLK